MIASTPRTFRPKASAFSIAASELPPVVTTSSTITTDSPACTGPSTSRPVPCCLASLRTMKPLSCLPAAAGDRDDRRGDRIGADRHAADGVGQVAAQQLQHPVGDQVRPGRIERHLAAVEVVVRLLARGEREVAELQGQLADEVHQGGLVVHSLILSEKSKRSL